MLFLLVGAVSAVELNNVSSTEDSNLATDNVNALSVENKLEVSSEDSISETNIVNSHDDDLDNHLDDALKSALEDDYGKVQTSENGVGNDGTSSKDVLSASSDNKISASSKISSNVDVSDTHYAKSATYFKVTLKDNNGKAIGNQKISLNVNGKSYSAVSDNSGIASVKTAALAIGTYTVTVSFAGNSNYSASSLSKKVKVLSSVSGSDVTKYYGPVSEYSVTFWKNYDALANTQVSFTINGATYTKTTDSNGVAKLPINLAPGNYVISAVNPYSGEKLSNNYISKKDSSTLTHGTDSTYILPNNNFAFTVTLKSKHGVLISGKTITFKYGDVQVTAKTDSNGKATITIPGLSKGTYSISYSYSGDKYYSGSSESGKLYVKDFTAKLTSSTLKMVYNDGSKFAVTLKDNNKPLANEDVKITINGVTYTEKTDSNGVAYKPVGLKPGTYAVTYQYLTPGSFNYCQGSDKIVVSKQTATLSAGDLVMKYNDGSSYNVIVKDKSGNPLKNIDVKLTINGVTYNLKTDSNGVAKKPIGLKIGNYPIKAVISNDYYQSSTVSKTIYVKEKLDPKISASTLKMVYNDGSKFAVTLKDNNKPLANRDVKITINGVTYTEKTDINGVAYKPVGLKPGTYTVTYQYVDSDSPNCKGSSKIVVSKQTATLSAGDLVMKYNDGSNYNVIVKDKSGNPLKNIDVKLTINGVTYTLKTDSNGVAKKPIGLKIGDYAVKAVISDDYYQSSTVSKTIHVKEKYDPNVKLTSSPLNMVYQDGSKFAVTLTEKNVPLAKKNIQFTVNGVTYTYKTNSNGTAYLPIGLKPGTYTIAYQYLTPESAQYCEGSNKVVVSKRTASLSAGDLVMKYKDGSSYNVTVKDKSGNPLNNINVKFTINGVTYTHKTDSNGIAKLDIALGVGYYAIKTVISDGYYQSNTASKYVSVIGTKLVGENLYAATDKSVSYSVKALDYKNNPIKNTKITFTVNGKTYYGTTDSNGVAKVNLGTLSAGTYTVKYSQESFSGSSKIYVANLVTIKQLIDASKTLRDYIDTNHKLPSTVKINGVSYSIQDYLYLASKAIINLKSGNTASIYSKNVAAPSSPSSTYSYGNLNNYLSVAKSIISTADSKSKMPDSVSSDIGTIGYNPLVYAFARVVAFYGENDVMPSYVTVKSLSGSTKSINSENTIDNLKPYLASSKNCQVNNSQIKQIVTKLTKGLKTDVEKATAIFNYVRDTISYSFYYDTKYGAVGTLNAKSGNCVDHSHLLVAMYRTAGLAARYVHGTCTFSSGSTYGHVWAQVLIGDTWTVSDATSTRNSLGKVVNWNTNSYSLHGYYSSLSF